MKIDLHTHILPERLPDWTARFGYGGFVSLDHHAPCRARMMIGDQLFREIEDNCWSPVRRLADCDAAGVSLQVLSTIPVLFSYWARPQDALDVARFLNDHIAQVVAQHPDRFVGLGTLPLQAPDLAIAELERCMRPVAAGGLGLAGVQIGSHVNAWNLNEPALFPVFERAAALSAAVFVHPWDMMGKERMPKYWLPWLVGMPAETSLAICCMIFGGVLERLPSLRVAFAHGGGAFPATLGRIEHGFKVRPDLCACDNSVNPRHYLAEGDAPARFWVDSLTHDADAVRLLLRLFGARRVALGSDYPFPLGEARPGTLIEQMTGLTPAQRADLLGGAAAEFLAIDHAAARA